jgi:serine/threonine protein kinase
MLWQEMKLTGCSSITTSGGGEVGSSSTQMSLLTTKIFADEVLYNFTKLDLDADACRSNEHRWEKVFNLDNHKRRKNCNAQALRKRINPLAEDLINQMLTFDHAYRPSLSVLLEHPFFTEEEEVKTNKT